MSHDSDNNAHALTALWQRRTQKHTEQTGIAGNSEFLYLRGLLTGSLSPLINRDISTPFGACEF